MNALEVVTPVAATGFLSLAWLMIAIPAASAAVLLLVVLIGALIAAGAFAGRQDDTVAPVTRPTIPAVPADPSDIPPLR